MLRNTIFMLIVYIQTSDMKHEVAVKFYIFNVRTTILICDQKRIRKIFSVV